MDTIGREEERVLIRESPYFQGLKNCVLGKRKVFLLERCPYFRSVGWFCNRES